MKKIATALLFLLFTSIASLAQRFDYNVGFDYILSNYEFDASHGLYDPSYTLHAVRLTPEAGILLPQSKSVYHRVRAGVDIFRQMGEGLEAPVLFQELVLYYNVEARLRHGRTINAMAGCFPRRYCTGKGYSGPFFDDDLLYMDPQIEGFMVNYSRGDRLRSELILDWPGMRGDLLSPERRERFQVLADGSLRIIGGLGIAWTGSFYHYACSVQSPNVVDNHMFYPRVEWHHSFFFKDISLSAGPVLTYQCDRAVDPAPVFPMGLLSEQSVSKWHLTLANRLYYGDDLMPFYLSSYGGSPYGRSLYFGDQGFRTLRDDPSWADWFSLRYEPHISGWLRLQAAVTLYLGEPSEALGTGVFRGWQQTLRLSLDLDSLRPHPDKPSGRRGVYL